MNTWIYVLITIQLFIYFIIYLRMSFTNTEEWKYLNITDALIISFFFALPSSLIGYVIYRFSFTALQWSALSGILTSALAITIVKYITDYANPDISSLPKLDDKKEKEKKEEEDKIKQIELLLKELKKKK